MSHSQNMSQGRGVSFSQTGFQKRTPKVALIRQEFVDLTGDPLSAVVLNQLLYWTQRVKDFDLLLAEERSFNPECNVSPRHGWIYKTAHELIEETMLRVSHPTMRKYLKLLGGKGWIDERPHPLDKWNKTTQYRVNLRKLHHDLQAIGHTLPEAYRDVFASVIEEKAHSWEGFSKGLEISREMAFNASHDAPEEDSFEKDFSGEPFGSEAKAFHRDEKLFALDEKNSLSNVKNLQSYTYTEITPEIKNRERCARERLQKSFCEGALNIWKSQIGQEVGLTDGRQHRLEALLSVHFQKDLTQWDAFCKRISSSSFLMGKGSRKWHVTLDWVLDEGNLLKVLEGNYDDASDPHSSLDPQKAEALKTEREDEIQDILATIQDPVWKRWCQELTSFLEESPHKTPIRPSELALLAKAAFLEVEDGRLAWIESHDPSTLDQIEKFRLEILSLIQRTFPNVRNIRTRIQASGSQEPENRLQDSESMDSGSRMRGQAVEAGFQEEEPISREGVIRIQKPEIPGQVTGTRRREEAIRVQENQLLFFPSAETDLPDSSFFPHVSPDNNKGVPLHA